MDRASIRSPINIRTILLWLRNISVKDQPISCRGRLDLTSYNYGAKGEEKREEERLLNEMLHKAVTVTQPIVYSI